MQDEFTGKDDTYMKSPSLMLALPVATIRICLITLHVAGVIQSSSNWYCRIPGPAQAGQLVRFWPDQYFAGKRGVSL